MTPAPSAIPAATLVIVRDRANGVASGVSPEILMVERARTMAFAGGALVFPGGRVDPGDRALATTLGGDPDDTAARIAAIRETIEEVGVAIGVDPAPGPAMIAAMRTAFHAGAPIATVLAEAGVAPVLDRLEPFARWRPAHLATRLFDTRFYLARWPDDAAPASVDATENVRLLWTDAAAILAAADRGEATIVFPTRRNLERLATLASFDAAVAHARAYPQRVIVPWIEDRDGGAQLCIPTGLGYPIDAEPLDSARRG